MELNKSLRIIIRKGQKYGDTIQAEKIIVEGILSQLRQAVEGLKNPYNKEAVITGWVRVGERQNLSFENCRQAVLKLLAEDKE